MARKATTTKKSEKTTTAVRNTAIPKAAPALAAAPEVTYETIRMRAYEIYCAGHGGGELDHWLQAERELRAA